MVMRIVNEFPTEERGIAAVIYPLGPKPKDPLIEDEADGVQAKVVRSPQRKSPKATVEGVVAK